MIPEPFLQAAINREVKGKGSPAMFARRLERNFEKLDTDLAGLTARTDGNFGTTWATVGLGVPAAAAVTADRVYYGGVQVLTSTTITGIQWFNGTVAGNVAVALYDTAGTRIANVATPVAVAGALAVQRLPFDTAYAASPGIYFMGIVFSGTPNMVFDVYALPCSYAAGPGTGATATSITAPTTSAQSIVVMSTY